MELAPLFAWLNNLLESIGLGRTLTDIIALVFLAVAVFGVLCVIALFLVWWERKISAHVQQRFGPMMTGWHGILQTIADALKLLQKEDRNSII